MLSVLGEVVFRLDRRSRSGSVGRDGIEPSTFRFSAARGRLVVARFPGSASAIVPSCLSLAAVVAVTVAVREAAVFKLSRDWPERSAWQVKASVPVRSLLPL